MQSHVSKRIVKRENGTLSLNMYTQKSHERDTISGKTSGLVHTRLPSFLPLMSVIGNYQNSVTIGGGFRSWTQCRWLMRLNIKSHIKMKLLLKCQWLDLFFVVHSWAACNFFIIFLLLMFARTWYFFIASQARSTK